MGTYTTEQASAIQAELDAIVESPHFSSSKRSQDFLEFIVLRTLEGKYDNLTERFLGVELFGRAIDYETGTDSVVRVRATDVRRRLAQYYSDHRATPEVMIHLASGTYIPEFQWVAAMVTPDAREVSQELFHAETSVLPAKSADPFLPAPFITERTRNRRPMLVIPIAATVLVACWLGWWARGQVLDRSLFPWKYEPAVNALWSQLLGNGHATDIVISDVSFQIVEILRRERYNLNSYLNRSYLDPAQDAQSNAAMQSALNLIGPKEIGSASESRLARRIETLGWIGNGIRVYNSRDYSSSLVANDNLILIGSDYTNPWQQLFDDQLNFVLETGIDSSGSIRNKAPRPGEQSIYIRTKDSGYCVVAFLQNPEDNTNALLIQGSSSEATEAGGDFVLSENELSDFEKMLHVQTLPYFEVVLKTSQGQGQRVPISATVQAYRIHLRQH